MRNRNYLMDILSSCSGVSLIWIILLCGSVQCVEKTIEFSTSQRQVFERGQICFVWFQVFISTISPCLHGRRCEPSIILLSCKFDLILFKPLILFFSTGGGRGGIHYGSRTFFSLLFATCRKNFSASTYWQQKFSPPLCCQFFFRLIDHRLNRNPKNRFFSIFGNFDHVWAIRRWSKNLFFINYTKIDVYFRRQKFQIKKPINRSSIFYRRFSIRSIFLSLIDFDQKFFKNRQHYPPCKLYGEKFLEFNAYVRN